jgi:hypothetical protein
VGAAARLARFAGGSLIGIGIGSAAAFFLAPESGDGLRHKLRVRLGQAKLAGREAEAAMTAELARRFRERVNDPGALVGAESEARQRVDGAADALRAIEASGPTSRSATLPPGA